MQLVSYKNTMRNAKPYVAPELPPAKVIPWRDRQQALYDQQQETLRQARLTEEEGWKARKAEADAAIRAANTRLAEINAQIVACEDARTHQRRMVDSPLTLDRIMQRICRATGQTPAALKSNRRNAELVLARHAFVYWAVRRTTRTTPEIGRYLGDRDHTTVLHSRKAYVQRRAAMGRTLREVR